MLTRTRIIFFALIILGSFANFAQNEWGTTLITICEGLIALAFIIDSIFHLRNRMKLGKTYNEGSFYEHLLLGLLFLGFSFKNLWWPFASEIIILSSLLLLPFYVKEIIKFYKTNIGKGKLLVTLLTVGSITTLILGVGIIFKIMHWPGAMIMYYVGLGFTVLMMIGSAKWNFDFDNKKINIISALGLLKNNIILLYFLTFTVFTFGLLGSWGYAPKFYSQKLPPGIAKELNKKDTHSDEKAEQIFNCYCDFEDNCTENGFLE